MDDLTRRAVDLMLANPVLLAVEIERYLSIWLEQSRTNTDLGARHAYAECAENVLRAFVAASRPAPSPTVGSAAKGDGRG